MAKIIKRDGSTEDLDLSKLEHSLRSAGASESTVGESLGMIPDDAEGMTAEEMRALISMELWRRDPKAASRYDYSRNLVARKASQGPQTVRLSGDVMDSLGFHMGDSVMLLSNGKWCVASVDDPIDQPGQLDVGDDILDELECLEGDRITVRKFV